MGRTVAFRSLAAGLGLGALFLSTGCANGEPNPSATNTSDQLDVEEIMLGDYLEYESLSDAVAASERTFIGTALSSKSIMLYPEVSGSDDPLENPQASMNPKTREEFRKNSGVVETVTRVRVEVVLSGEINSGDVIEVQQTGGTFEGTAFSDPSVTLLSGFTGTDQQFLFNLNPLPERFAPVSPKFGVLRVTGDTLSGLDGSSVKESLSDVKVVISQH